MGRATPYLSVSGSSGTGVNSVTLTVPAGHTWQLTAVAATFLTSETVGNRRIRFVMLNDADNPMYTIWAKSVQVAERGVEYFFGDGLPVADDLVTGMYSSAPIPSGMLAPGGYKIKIDDVSNIDAVGDSLSVRVMIVDMVE